MLSKKRVLIFALALFTAILTFGSFVHQALADNLLTIPFFSQKDPKWAEEFLDNSPYTIGASGCALTSTTMVVGYYGVGTDPKRLNEALTPIGGIDTDGNIHWDVVPQVCEGKVVWIERVDQPDFARITSEIDQNYPVIIDVRTTSQSQHFVAMRGKIGDNYYFYDPGDEKPTDRIWPVGRYGAYDMIGLRIYHGTAPEEFITDWPFHQRDLANTGNNPEALGIRNPKLDDKPMTIEGTSAYAQPVVEGDMVYLATTDGKVYASDMERKLCPWFFDTGAEEIKLTPALVGNKLYVLDSNNVLWCLDKRNGHWIWYFDIIGYFGLPDYYWQTSPQVWQNNYVCMTVGPYAVFIYDDIEIASKGPKIAKLAKAPIQSQSEPAEFIATSVISEDGIFYCFDFACNLIAFNIQTAGYFWHISEFPGPKDPAGLTYLGNPFAIVLAEDVLILKNNWRFDFQDTIPKPGETGFLYAVNIKTHDKILWAREIGLTSCPSVYKDGALYSYGLFAPQEPGKIEGIVYCLDPKTGSLLTDNAISVNDDIHISIGGDIMYLSCWTFKKVFAVIFDPFEILWQRDLAYHPFSAVVPVEDKAYVSMLDIPIQTQRATLWPDAKTRPLLTGNIILTSFSETPPVYQKGDVSMDGNITAHDAKLIMQHVVGQIKLTPEQLELADVSNNGQVSSLDAGMVMQMMTGVKKGVKKK